MSQSLLDIIQSVAIFCLGVSVLLILWANRRRKP